MVKSSQKRAVSGGELSCSKEKGQFKQKSTCVFPKDSINRPPHWLEVFKGNWFDTIAYIVLEQRTPNAHGLLIPLKSFFVDGLH